MAPTHAGLVEMLQKGFVFEFPRSRIRFSRAFKLQTDGDW